MRTTRRRRKSRGRKEEERERESERVFNLKQIDLTTTMIIFKHARVCLHVWVYVRACVRTIGSSVCAYVRVCVRNASCMHMMRQFDCVLTCAN